MSDIYSFAPLWGQWEIEEEIGSGLYGTVYRGKAQTGSDTVYCAIKHIHIEKQATAADEAEASDAAETQADDASAREEILLNTILEETGQGSAFRNCKNLLACQEQLVIEQEDKSGYDIFLRYPLLTSLAELLEKQELSSEEKIKMMVDLCSGLDALENGGIVHGDIKPENIFVDEEGSFKLADFGISKKTDRIVNKNAVKQTVAFMAPELQENKSADTASDIYALGLLMYKLFNYNREPFLPQPPQSFTKEEKNEAILKRMKGAPIPAPAQADENLSKIILIACQHNPKARWINAAAFKNALLSYEPGGNTADAAAAVLETEAPAEKNDILNTEDIDAFDSETAADIAPAESLPPEPVQTEAETMYSDSTNTFDVFEDSDIEFADDEEEKPKHKRSKGKTALIVAAILVVLALLGGVIYFAISSNMFNGTVPATADSASSSVETQKTETTVPPTTAAPTTQPKTEAAATEPAPAYVTVPDVVGDDYKDAIDELSYAGLNVSIHSYAYSDSFAANTVIEVTPGAGESIESGSTVSIIVSQGSKPTEEPKNEESVSSIYSNPSSNTEKTGGYILEGSDSREIDASEVSSMDERTMTLALNEIYARHGRIFSTPYLADYFNSKSWYTPKYSASEFNSLFTPNKYEQANIDTIVKVMQEKGYR